MDLKQLSDAETPKCGEAWLGCSSAQRRDLVKAVIGQLPECRALVEVVHLQDDGQVTVRFGEPVPADRRGGLLLDLEAALKERVDPGLTVWLEPLGDKNSLRKLRGIDVRSEVRS
jgi:hypothetical protein